MRATFIKKRQMAARSSLGPSLRPLLAGSLIIALISAAYAQSLIATLASQVEAITASVMGRAPVVTVAIDNQTRPGEAGRVGNTLQATASANDPDLDTITATSYRWLRNGVEIATTRSYTVVGADRGTTLTAEAIATTDAAITDPASGSGTATISVEMSESLPEAYDLAIDGVKYPNDKYKLASPLTGSWKFRDLDDDQESGTTVAWIRADNPAGTVNRVPIPDATQATYTPDADADSGKFLVFEVTPRAATGENPGAVARTAVKMDSLPRVVFVNLTGTPAVGEELSVTFGISDADGDSRYATVQWYRVHDVAGTDPHPVGSGITYVVRPEDVGHHIMAVVTAASHGGTVVGKPYQTPGVPVQSP